MLAWMQEMLDKLLAVVISLFPLSPFLPVIQDLGALPFLGYLNWFVPVGDMLKIGVLWVAAIAAYYGWMVVARWIKLLT